MRRTIKVRLSRQVGKGKKARTRSISVTVYQVTLRGFTEAVRAGAEYVLRFREQVRGGKDLTERDVVMALAHPAVTAAIADVLCPAMPRGWFEPWHSVANIQRMVDAARKTSDWWRLISELNLVNPEAGKGKGAKDGAAAPPQPSSPAQKRKGTGLYEDAVLLARMVGVNPLEVIDVWPMEHFLDVAESLVRAREVMQEQAAADGLAGDPTSDPDAKPTPIVAGVAGKVWTA